MAYTIQIKRATASRWADLDPVLAAGEPGVETDTAKIKIGDGTTAWNSLAYSSGGGTELTFLDGGTPTSIYGGFDPIDGGGV